MLCSGVFLQLCRARYLYQRSRDDFTAISPTSISSTQTITVWGAFSTFAKTHVYMRLTALALRALYRFQVPIAWFDFSSYSSFLPLFSLCALFSNAENEENSTFASYCTFFCRRSFSPVCRALLHAWHRVQFITFFRNPHPAHQLKARTDMASEIILSCHASPRHQNTIHQVVPVFSFLLPSQILLPYKLR